MTVSAAPQYRVKTRSFFEPYTVEAGTVIEYEGVPGDHLEPLNSAAEERMEEFYSASFAAHDPRTRKPTGEMVQPRQGRRPTQYVGAEASRMTVLAEPDTAAMALNVQSLGEIMAARKNTDQRPAAAPIPVAIPVKAVAPPAETK